MLCFAFEIKGAEFFVSFLLVPRTLRELVGGEAPGVGRRAGHSRAAACARPSGA